MEPYNNHTSIAALINRSNVDTDQIIPKQFLKKVERSGFGIHLFHDWRFNDDGSDNPDFELNKPAFQSAKILVTGDNFGCGSSREHAPWAIADYGFNTIISSSYADIFYNNCFKNGILPIRATQEQLQLIANEINSHEGCSLTINLEEQTVVTPLGNNFAFELDPFRKENLLHGLDDIGLTLEQIDKIDEYEQKHRRLYPWLWT
ncbi:MAG TPA: 3-isopropylmalate dehydratase small subunit [Methylococcaceae bacterium]|jgi:3-isopropylmalate/(R)-2-methylmalate dehydratase small subunit|nr:3-isopropylmalate dehydratase small subunit [Methylococcaceae bacterium]HIN68725.1 3-isopropylmalate dehydratase small subunit [Methylococcales bacterium]HIA45044.1 3-isopropylmalate dehydratase small subunit [Methylococcaceae bacterium]HIB61589.1 3-isopropylmalate dehydratase small subunit [Methylococcaceae bacterium]HIO13226.1 3-isopropylmalate dehydratase small subunit [Methylococcales bacterium]